MTTERTASPVIRRTTTTAVVVVAGVAAVVSYSHMQQLADHAGEAWRSWLIPISIDGLVIAASMVLLTRHRAGQAGGWLAWGSLSVGVVASLAANMADARPEVTSVLVAGWAPVAFAATFHLLLQQRRAETADRLSTDRTGPVVLTEPAGPVRPTLTAPFAPSGVEGSAQRTVRGSAYHPLSPDPLPDWSAPHPEAPRLDTVTAPRGGPTSQVKDPDPQSDPPADSLTDEDLIRAVRDWAVEEGSVPSRERVRTRYGVGSKRADRARTAALTPDHPTLRVVPTGGGR